MHSLDVQCNVCKFYSFFVLLFIFSNPKPKPNLLQYQKESPKLHFGLCIFQLNSFENLNKYHTNHYSELTTDSQSKDINRLVNCPWKQGSTDMSKSREVPPMVGQLKKLELVKCRYKIIN